MRIKVQTVDIHYYSTNFPSQSLATTRTVETFQRGFGEALKRWLELKIAYFLHHYCTNFVYKNRPSIVKLP